MKSRLLYLPLSHYPNLWQAVQRATRSRWTQNAHSFTLRVFTSKGDDTSREAACMDNICNAGRHFYNRLSVKLRVRLNGYARRLPSHFHPTKYSLILAFRGGVFW